MMEAALLQITIDRLANARNRLLQTARRSSPSDALLSDAANFYLICRQDVEVAIQSGMVSQKVS